MKRPRKLSIFLALAIIGGLPGFLRAGPANLVSLQHQLEQIAQTNDYYSLSFIINNRPIRLWPAVTYVKQGTNSFRLIEKPDPLLAEQFQLLRTLQSVSGDRAGLVTLLTNANPRVRTLALGALFQREDGHDLPLIASLINDPAPTFPDLHDSMNQQGGRRLQAELTNSLTVGDVARSMLAFWGVESSASRGFGNFTSLSRQIRPSLRRILRPGGRNTPGEAIQPVGLPSK